MAYVIAAEHGGYDYRELATKTHATVSTLRHVFVAQGDPGEFEALSEVAEEPVGYGGPRPDDLAFLQLSGGSTGVPKLIPRTHDDYIYSLWGSNEICAVDENSVYPCVLPAAHNLPALLARFARNAVRRGRVVLCPGPSPEVAFPLIEREGVIHHRARRRRWPCSDGGRARHRARPQQPGRPAGGRRQVQRGGGPPGAARARLHAPAGVRHGRGAGQLHPSRRSGRDDRHHPGPAHLARRRDPRRRRRGPGGGHGRDGSPADPRPVHHPGLLERPRPQRPSPSPRTASTAPATSCGSPRPGTSSSRGVPRTRSNRGGEKIAAEEVENHILAHPAVHDANVVAEPDPYLGERTCAYVILRSARARSRRWL